MRRIRSRPADRLDIIARREMGADSDRNRQTLLYANPQLIFAPFVLPARTEVNIPDAADVLPAWIAYGAAPLDSTIRYDVGPALPLPSLPVMRAYSLGYSEGYS